MNRNAKNALEKISGGASAYRNEVAKVLGDFNVKEQRAREDSRQYKDEDSRYAASLAELTAATRAELAEKRTAFSNTVASEIETLQKEVRALALERPNPAFTDMLRAFADFNIMPTKTQIESLMQMNSGNILGNTMLNACLEKTGSRYRIESADFATLEHDIDALGRLADLAECYAPTENHSELCKVFKDTPRLRNGRNVGTTWDSVQLVTQRAFFESAVKDIDTMSARWSDTAPSVVQLEQYQPKERER